MTIGIAIKQTIGIGDALQYSSLFENYFRSKNEKLYVVTKHWFLDHNPYVIQYDDKSGHAPKNVVQMWNFSPTQYQWPIPQRREERPKVYLSNAEIWASLLGVQVFLNRPRLYKFEEYSYEERKMILLHTNGKSHGDMPKHVIDHVVNKYGKTGNLFRIGNVTDDLYPEIPRIQTNTLWDLAETISKASMLIGVDSGPSWIAACYPDVIVKKLRTKPNPPDRFADWVPLDIRNIHSHWDDRCHMIFNVSEHDIGFTTSYRKI